MGHLKPIFDRVYFEEDIPGRYREMTPWIDSAASTSVDYLYWFATECLEIGPLTVTDFGIKTFPRSGSNYRIAASINKYGAVVEGPVLSPAMTWNGHLTDEDRYVEYWHEAWLRTVTHARRDRVVVRDFADAKSYNRRYNRTKWPDPSDTICTSDACEPNVLRFTFKTRVTQ